MKLPNNSVAAITGAGSGIGRSLAQLLAQAGASLALADVNEAGLQETAGLCAPHGGKISTRVLDVAQAQQIADWAQAIQTEHGRVTHLFNNAGVGLLGTVEELSLADIEWLMGVNFWGVVYGVKFFLPLLKQAEQAHIINISSVFGLFAPAGQSAYCASKFAVRGFTEALRHELAGSPIKVSTVHPGGIRTAIARNSRIGEGADANQKARANARFDRMARTTPDQAAATIMRGVERGQPRILIGADAWILDKLIRVLPLKHWPLVKSQVTISPQSK